MNDFEHNGLCHKLGIRIPIIQAPMAGGATTPELIARVSNAGGLGSLGAGYLSADQITQAIADIRALTEQPFAVNLFIPQAHNATPEAIQTACHDIEQCSAVLNQAIQPRYENYAQPFEQQIQVVIEQKVPVFSFTFGLLDEHYMQALKANGTVLIGTATTLAEALALEKNGVDIIVLQGCESGGHRGTFLTKEEEALIKLPELIIQCADQLSLPIIAAGGIMQGKDIAAALRLGASGVQMGTAFLSCHEAGINTAYKSALLSQQQDNTALTRAFSGKLARGIRNTFIDCMASKPTLDYPIQNALTKAMRNTAKDSGNIEFMSLWAGQGVAHCRDLSANELINQLVAETRIA